MASINGISVKKLNMFTGHEGEVCYQGNVYLGTKKLGFWSQDDWGGPDRFDFSNKEIEKRLNDRVAELNQDKAIHGVSYNGNPYTLDYSLDILLYDLIKLQDREKDFKKAIKDGYSGTLVLTDGYHVVTWWLKDVHLKMDENMLLSSCSKMIEDAKEKEKFYKNKEHVVKIYRHLSDFQIGSPITYEEICEKLSIDEKMAKAKVSNINKESIVNKESGKER